jgi:hypothetical protein
MLAGNSLSLKAVGWVAIEAKAQSEHLSAIGAPNPAMPSRAPPMSSFQR